MSVVLLFINQICHCFPQVRHNVCKQMLSSYLCVFLLASLSGSSISCLADWHEAAESVGKQIGGPHEATNGSERELLF